MEQRTSAQQTFIDAKIDAALEKFSLPKTSPMRAIVNRDAVIFDAGGRGYGVCIPGRDRDLSIEERLEELRADAMYRHNFPREATKIAKTDMRTLTQNFDLIASGKVIVGD